MDAYEWASKNELLVTSVQALQRLKLLGHGPEPKDLPSFRYACWLATFLSNSSNHKHRQSALLFAALVKQAIPDDPSIDAMCYTIFSRVGTLPAAMHLARVVNEKQEYVGPPLGILTDEFFVSYLRAQSPLIEGKVLTEFQKNTIESVANLNRGIISAPTSAGKSFVIHEFVKQRIRSRQRFVALFIVPTKALIAQVCAIYRRMRAKEGVEVDVLSNVPDEMVRIDRTTIFALTQERTVRLLTAGLAGEFDFIFCDEVQSIESPDRGALLEYVLHELSTNAPHAKMFAAGPFIANAKTLGSGIFRTTEEVAEVETEDSPVSQMVVQVTPIKGAKSIKMRVVDPSSKQRDYVFEMPATRSYYARWRGSHATAVSDSLGMFSSGSPSIVYAPGPGTAQNWATSYVQSLSASSDISQETEDLIGYVKESIHPLCSLVMCLEKRVAYHHGGLPDFVREEIEALFCQSDLDVLFCTSTLLEGVNLPAEKIFVASATKAEDALRPLEFKNLIGRAGRLDQHLCGLIYCIQIPQDDESEWIDAYRSEEREFVVPSVDATFENSGLDLLQILQSGHAAPIDRENKRLRPTITILRSRFLNDPDDAKTYLGRKKLSPEMRNDMLEALSSVASTWRIPRLVAIKNPYVDPVLQDELFKQVESEPLAWSVRREKGFSTDFDSVFKKLDAIFGIIDEIGPYGNPEYYRRDLLSFSKLWLRGKPFKDIIHRAIPSRIRDSEELTTRDVDAAIKRSMEIVSREVGYVTAKYFSVLAEIVKAVVPEAEHDKYAMTIGLPAMLELGCSDQKTLSLIGAMIPRGAAIRIARVIPDDAEDPVAWLSVNRTHERVKQLPTIYKKILGRSGIWP